MAKLVLDTIVDNANPFVKINENNQRIVDAVENTLSRDGTAPNFMDSDLDMNGYNILNQRNQVALDSFNWRGDWVTDRLYAVGDTVYHEGSSYINLTEHTSDVFADDFVLGYWDVVVDTSFALPDQTGQAGKYLGTNGTAAEWIDLDVVYEPIGAAATAVASLDAQLATVAKSGDYNDLINPPSIPSPQVNSDWDAVSGVSQILNKPTIPAAQVNSDWTSVSGVSEIINKPTISTFAETYLDDVDAAAMKTTLEIIAASGAEANTGTDTSKFITAAVLASVKSIASNGYLEIAGTGGLLLQWGVFTSSAAGYTDLTFPKAWTTSVWAISANVNSSGVTSYVSLFDYNPATLTTVPCAVVSGAGAYSAQQIRYIAIGK